MTERAISLGDVPVVDVKVLTLSAQSVIVIEIPAGESEQSIWELSLQTRVLFPKNRVLLLQNGATLRVIEPA